VKKIRSHLSSYGRRYIADLAVIRFEESACLK
jgi:hypothetical protein